MRVDPVSLYPERASRGALLRHVKDSVQHVFDGPEVHHKDGDPVHPIENAAGRFDEPGEPMEINGCLNERPTRLQSHRAHRQSRFQIRTFLSKAGAGRTMVYAPGKQILFEQGKRGSAVFYILTGTVKLSVVSHGKETTIGLLGPGNFAGNECIATVRPRRTTSARALTNCTIIKIERKEMLRVIQHEKTFAAFFLNYLLACMSRYQEVIVDQLLNSSEKRLAQALLTLTTVGSRGRPEQVVPQIHQEELAELVGTTRSRISFFMNRFRKLGFIAYKGQGSITIHTAKLSRFVLA